MSSLRPPPQPPKPPTGCDKLDNPDYLDGCRCPRCTDPDRPLRRPEAEPDPGEGITEPRMVRRQRAFHNFMVTPPPVVEPDEPDEPEEDKEPTARRLGWGEPSVVDAVFAKWARSVEVGMKG